MRLPARSPVWPVRSTGTTAYSHASQGQVNTRDHTGYDVVSCVLGSDEVAIARGLYACVHE